MDLVVLPPAIDGARCDNCKFYAEDYCKNAAVLQPVEDHWCCSAWDAPGTIHIGRQ